MKKLLTKLDKKYIKVRHIVKDLAFLRHAQSIYNVAS